MITPEGDEAGEDVYFEEVSTAMVLEQATLNRLDTYIQEIKDTSEMLASLPHKLTHEVMVPFGSMAMFPGKLIHTNEVSVFLGADTQANVSTHSAQKMLARREAFVTSQANKVREQLASLGERMSFKKADVNEDGDEVVDIVETYDEAVHGPIPARSSVQPSSSAELDSSKPSLGSGDTKAHESSTRGVKEEKVVTLAGHDPFTVRSDSDDEATSPTTGDYDAEISRLAAAFDDSEWTAESQDRECVVPGPKLIEELHPPSEPPTIEKKRPSKTSSKPGFKKGFLGGSTDPKPKSILKITGTPAPVSHANDQSSQGNKRTDQSSLPRVSGKLIDKDAPTPEELAAFSGVISERKNAPQVQQSAGLDDSARVHDHAESSTGHDAVRGDQGGRNKLDQGGGALGLDQAKGIASLSRDTPVNESLDHIQFEDTSTNKPVSKFRARLLHSRGPEHKIR